MLQIHREYELRFIAEIINRYYKVDDFDDCMKISEHIISYTPILFEYLDSYLCEYDSYEEAFERILSLEYEEDYADGVIEEVTREETP